MAPSHAAAMTCPKKRACSDDTTQALKKGKVATTSVLEMLRQNKEQKATDHTESTSAAPMLCLNNNEDVDKVEQSRSVSAPSVPTVRGGETALAYSPSTAARSLDNYVHEITREIDARRIVLSESCWVKPPSPQSYMERENTKRRATGANDVTAPILSAIVARPSVFVWAPDYLGPIATIACPTCGNAIREMRWHKPRLLHGLSQLFSYITREYICSQCTKGHGKQQRRRDRSSFLADTPSFLATLPEHVRTLWQFNCTGKILCDPSVSDFVRAMATRTSWSAIAACINEMRQTTWARSIQLPYLKLCAHLGVRAVDEDVPFPASFLVTADWIRHLYMSEWKARAPEVQDELKAEKGTDVLVVDWTRDAAARCGSEWLFNAMDGRHAVLCSGLTPTCCPSDAVYFLKQLQERGVAPKVVYVDSECCGARPPLIQDLWPGAAVRLDGMHAIRRLTRTVSSTQHPWHGRFCHALSSAIYTEDAAEVNRIREARRNAGLSECIPKRTRTMCIPRIITDKTHIIEKIEKVLKQFQPPTGRGGSLLTAQTWEAWQNLKQHIAAGCLCDPHGVELNWFGDEKVIDGVRLPIVCKARGASALEGFHTHQKAWLGPLARHTSDVGEALLADGALRWNRHSVRRGPMKHASIYAPGMRQELAPGSTYARGELQPRSPTNSWAA